MPYMPMKVTALRRASRNFAAAIRMNAYVIFYLGYFAE